MHTGADIRGGAPPKSQQVTLGSVTDPESNALRVGVAPPKEMR